MTSLILPSRLTRQPQQWTPVDKGNPLSRGLVYAKSHPGSPAPAAIGSSTATQPFATEGRERGLSTRFTGSTGGTVDVAGDAGKSPRGTVLVFHQSTVMPPNGGPPTFSYSHVLAATSSGGTTGNGWLLMLGNGDGKLQFRIYNTDNGSEVAAANGTVPLNDGKPHVTVATWDTAIGGRLNTYVDGDLHVAGSALTQNVSIAQPIRIGRSYETSNFWGKFEGNMYLVAAWDRILSPAEVKAVSANPWQLFAAPQRRMLVATTSAPVGGSYTLPAAQGSYTITGNDAGLRAARRLVASPGVYTLTGNAANLRAARRLVAAPGAYAITGNAANLIKGTAPKSLQAAAGSYVITGRPAALRAARWLAAAPGAYAITGFSTAAPPVGTVSGSKLRFANATIMGLGAALGIVNLGPDRIQKTVALL